MKPIAHLEEDQLLSQTFDASLTPALKALAAFHAHVERPIQDGDKGTARDAAMAKRAQLLAACRALPQGPEFIDETTVRCFAEASFFWLWYAESGGALRVDTSASPSLAEFPVDLPTDEGAHALVLKALQRGFGWSRKALEAIGDKQAWTCSNRLLKAVITNTLADLFKQDANQDPKARALALMTRVFGPLPFRSVDVDFILTSTGIFFLVPFEVSQMAGFETRPPTEREALKRYVDDLAREAMSLAKMRFPAFGRFDQDQLDPVLLSTLEDAIRAQPGLSTVDTALLRSTLATMVTILPSAEPEKYLVHDAWGHAWQESLGDFEWHFEDLRELPRPLHPEQLPALREAFHSVQGRSVVDAERWERLVAKDLKRRITIGAHLLVAEALADLVEYKFGQQRWLLDSSSLVHRALFRLDLSLDDGQRACRLWSMAYEELAEDPSTRQRLAEALHSEALPREGLDEAINSASQQVTDRFAAAFRRDLIVTHDDAGRPLGSVVQRLGLLVAALEAAVEDLLTDGERRYQAMVAKQGSVPRWYCPSACLDLIVLQIGWFYEQNEARNIWLLPSYVRDELGPLLRTLEHALAEELEG